MRRLLLFVLMFAGVLLVPATAAEAHPLGNFSVNQLAALSFTPSDVTVAVTVDFAELPTLQESLDAAAECDAFRSSFAVRVDGSPLAFSVASPSLVYSPGSGGLRTSRLTCTLAAPAPLDRQVSVDVATHYRDDRVGWRELTAVATGVHLVDSPLPTGSRTDGLRTYPDDLLSSPPDVRTAHLSVAPGGASSPPASPSSPSSLSSPTSLSSLPWWLSRADAALRGFVGSRSLTPWVGFLAVLLALVLGGAHAALPGHGKTVMAAYLAGRQGRPRDALAVGATVTLTHTGGVLALGLLLTSVAGLAGETVLAWLGVVSGLLVAAVGVGMLRNRRLTTAHSHAHSHSHSHSHGFAADRSHSHDDGFAAGHSHSHDHGSGAGHSHSHDHGFAAGHSHSHAPGRPSRWAIVGMGVAGGLVPSPSALVVLLGAISLGRTWFGILLVLAYGAGMAAVLTAAGLLLIRIRDRWRRPTRLRLPARLAAWAPNGTAALVLIVGSALAIRSLVTL
ncbi:sulfite exporter TauE/SafE family protein [Dactylosporangium vinaceum]|uniref:Nickel/cobalt transporter n=1 Tax=Dactylosporangium vinaceum TaxID=53362 RepID=A0ABV5MJ23_9ACTN|nr:sulfite exporter TauE/SafE family protein [Dactylosporangium vinaceum]UAB93701.1 sulfite exporter TauE/SafE family protein [Dactylosporangium vinaceum]